VFKWIIIHLNRNGACTVRKLTRASYVPSRVTVQLRGLSWTSQKKIYSFLVYLFYGMYFYIVKIQI
jgi:hypothetical protein